MPGMLRSVAQPGSGWHRKRDSPAAQARARDYQSAAHRGERARRVEAIKSGRVLPICSRCGRTLPASSAQWHLPHLPDRTGYYPGMWCRSCNLSEAASRGNRDRRRRRPPQGGTSPLTW